MSKGSASALCLAAAALLALGVQPATAAKKKPAKPGKVKTATATATTTANGQVVAATATCPKGTTAVGGGFFLAAVAGGGILSDLNLISESTRASARSWRVTAVRFDNGAAGPSLPVTADAYCRSKPGKISVTRASESVTGTGFLDPVAACPVGRSAVSGGFLASAGSASDLLLIGGGPVGSVGWQQTGLSQGSASLESQIHCIKRKKAPVARTAAITTAPSFGIIASAVTPACPAKLIPFGGGYAGPPFAVAGGGAAGLPLESRRSGSSWRVSTVNLTAAALQLTVTGVCS
ncbi:MAG: hypothetical protein FJW90_10215 [Actinobacteria bacterium]|nr:hypothetical protein [Actinomycetota bacterium]